jgi:hypothetical protein
MESWEQDDATTIIGALFDANAKLDHIGRRVETILQLLEEDDEEEEEDG